MLFVYICITVRDLIVTRGLVKLHHHCVPIPSQDFWFTSTYVMVFFVFNDLKKQAFLVFFFCFFFYKIIDKTFCNYNLWIGYVNKCEWVSEWVSERLLNANSAIFQLHHSENKLYIIIFSIKIFKKSLHYCKENLTK